jgi:O-antigen/teichoic acid export membrane protein
MSSGTSTAGRFVKHSTIYAIGNVSRQLVGFLMLPLYTQFLTPADYGVVGLLTFALALLEPFFGARLGDATLKFFYEETDEGRRRRVISTSLVITGTVSTIVALVAFLGRVPISNLLFGTERYALPVGLFAYVFVGQAVEYYGLTFIRIQQKPILFVTINLLKLAIQLAMNVWLIVYMKLGVTGVIISGTVSSLLFATGLALYTIYYNGIRFDTKIAKRMIVFSWPLWLSSLATLYIYSANRYYLRVFASMDQVGYFELAAKFAMILSLVIWQPFTQFWETERFQHYKKEAAPPIFSTVFECLSALMFIAALGISVFSAPIITVMAAPAFQEAAWVVPFLCFGGLFGFLSMYTYFSFLVTGATGMIGRNNYITVVIVTVLNILLIPRFGFLGAGAALFLALLMQFLLVRHASIRYYDMRQHLGPFFVMLGIAMAGYACANLIFMHAPFWWRLAWQVVVFCLFASLLAGVLLRTSTDREQMVRFFKSVVPLARRFG